MDISALQAYVSINDANNIFDRMNISKVKLENSIKTPIFCTKNYRCWQLKEVKAKFCSDSGYLMCVEGTISCGM